MDYPNPNQVPSQQYPPQYPPQTPPGQPPYYPPPVPPKKKGKIFWIFGIGCGSLVLILILCGIIAAVTSHSSNTGTASSSQQSSTSQNGNTPAASNQHFKVGDVVTVGNTWKVVVNSVKTNPGDGAFNTPQKGIYVIVDITLTNISNEEQNISSLVDFNMRGTDGTQYTEAITGNLPGVSESPNGKVEAGAPVKGDFVYDVPTSAKSFTFSFAPSLFSSGQTIWDLSV